MGSLLVLAAYVVAKAPFPNCSFRQTQYFPPTIFLFDSFILRQNQILLIRHQTFQSIIKNIMSYGWLTESAILPKKGKEIKVKESGLVGMEATLLQLKDKVKNQQPIKKNKTIKKNSGIEERMAKDEQKTKTVNNLQKNPYKYLQRKAALYDEINNKKRNVSKLLVDFEGREQAMTKKQQQQFEKDRQSFYNGKLSEISQQQKHIHDNLETEKSSLSQARQRLAWEKEVLSQLKKGGQQMEVKPKVIQSFDHKMTKEEKQALDSVLIEEKTERQRIQQIRRRKQALQYERIRKLKHLNIIKEGDRDSAEPQHQNTKNTKHKQD